MFRHIPRKHNSVNTTHSDLQAVIEAVPNPLIKIWFGCLATNLMRQASEDPFYWASGPSRIKKRTANKLIRKSGWTPFIGPEPFCSIGIENIYRKEFLEKQKAKREKLWQYHQGILRGLKIFGSQ